MREILFRGKRLDNGEWVASGNLLHANDNGKHSYYIPVHNDKFGTIEDECDNILSIEYGTFYKVDPDTVGQYTGLTDKNDKRIFEGDIVRTVATANDHHQKGATAIMSVRYWMGNPCLCFPGNDSGTPLYPLCVSTTIEVIGNIHDNPELLEVSHG